MFSVTSYVKAHAERTRLKEEAQRHRSWLNISHEGSGTYRGHPSHEPGVIDPFFYFLIAEVFLHEIYRAAKI